MTKGPDNRRRKEPNLRRELTERQLMTRSNSFLGQSLPVPSLGATLLTVATRSERK